MYSKLHGCVQVSAIKTTEYFKCYKGTRQGDVTNMIMFNLYMIEVSPFLHNKGHRGVFITDQIPDIICILFANDVANCADTGTQLNSISEFVMIPVCL
jgi:hypothetical protein